jgi:hypothetical protein
MADANLPYVPSPGTIKKALERIKAAQTPPRFDTDYLAKTLGMPGGNPRPVIPFLKRTGFLNSDGTPTDLYKRFRNAAQSGAAAAEALRIGYAPLYAINEQIHGAKPADIKGAIVQVTGAEEDSRTVQLTIASFSALKGFADFSSPPAQTDNTEESGTDENDGHGGGDGTLVGGLKLGYTINLHLPATSDVAVFNAIFKSLKEHLIR